MSRVEVGQRFRHKKSGDERMVYAIVPYRERAGCEPTEMERHFGVTHIAVMSDNPSDRRDSSDMLLDDKHRSLFAQDWVALSESEGKP